MLPVGFSYFRTRSKSFPADFYSSSKPTEDLDDELQEDTLRGTYLDEEFFLIDWSIGWLII